MTLEEKREALIQMEWEDFQKVQNEGGRASCQEDPKTFFRMRRSQFIPWPEELIDDYMQDIKDAREAGRNLLTEKYAWMMESTAPEQFAKIRPMLPPYNASVEQAIEGIAEIQIPWMSAYRKAYPVLGAGNRALYSSEDTPYETSFETYLRGELHTYSERTLGRYMSFVNRLNHEGKNLTMMIMEATVKEYGYRSLDEAEEKMARRNG